MQRNSLIIAIVGLLTCLVSFGATQVQRYWLDYFYITPGFTNLSRKTKVLMKLSSNGPVTKKLVNFYMYNSKYKTGSMITNLRPSDETGVITREITGTMFMPNEENKTKVFFSDSDSTKTNHWMYPEVNVDCPQLIIDKLPNGVYESPHVFAYEKDRGYFTTTNSYTFTNWYKENEIPVFNKFDIEMFTFEEKVGPLNVESSASDLCIAIPNKYGLFVDLNLHNQIVDRVELVLKLVDSGGYKYHLAFDTDLYVNPYTYEMARSQLPGFVKTKYLYLPKNGFHDFNKMDLYLVGFDLGTLKLSFNYTFSIEAERSRIGDCVTSEYCIKTGDSEYSDFGKDLKHD